MKLTENNGLRILKADSGMVLSRIGEEHPYFTNEIYLGKGDTPESYEELSIEEAEKICAENEEQNESE